MLNNKNTLKNSEVSLFTNGVTVWTASWKKYKVEFLWFILHDKKCVLCMYNVEMSVVRVLLHFFI